MVAFFPECDQDDVLDVYFLANSVFLLLAVTCCDMRRGSVCYRVEIFDWQAPHFVLAHRPSSWQAQQAFLRRGKSLPTLPSATLATLLSATRTTLLSATLATLSSN